MHGNTCDTLTQKNKTVLKIEIFWVYKIAVDGSIKDGAKIHTCSILRIPTNISYQFKLRRHCPCTYMYIYDDITRECGVQTARQWQLTTFQSTGVAVEKVEENEPLKSVHRIHGVPEKTRNGTPDLNGENVYHQTKDTTCTNILSYSLHRINQRITSLEHRSPYYSLCEASMLKFTWNL